MSPDRENLKVVVNIRGLHSDTTTTGCIDRTGLMNNVVGGCTTVANLIPV